MRSPLQLWSALTYSHSRDNFIEIVGVTLHITGGQQRRTPLMTVRVDAVVRQGDDGMTTYWHGGRRGIQRGAYILPPTITKAPSLSEYGEAGVHRRDRVYVTTSQAAALL